MSINKESEGNICNRMESRENKKRPHLCYLANAGSVHFNRWYEYFLKKDYKVTVISGDPCECKSRKIPWIDYYYLPEIKYKNRVVSFLINFVKLPLIIFKLKRIIKKQDIDILHAHQIHPYAFWGCLAGFRPFMVTPIGGDVMYCAKKYVAYNLITRIVFKMADVVTQDSYSLYEDGLKHGAKKGHNYIIQNGVDLEAFKKLDDETICELKQEMGLEKKYPILFYGRAFHSLYNIDVIVKAVKILKERYENIMLLLSAHSGDVHEEIFDLIKKSKLSEHTRFLGNIPQEEMYKYFNVSDLCISIPDFDSSPHFVYESIACRTPVIVNDLPWVKQMGFDKNSIHLVDRISETVLSEKVVNVLDNKTENDAVVGNGYKIISAKLCLEKNMSQMDDIYKQYLKKGNYDNGDRKTSIEI